MLEQILEDMKRAALDAGRIANSYRKSPFKLTTRMKLEAEQKHGTTPTPATAADAEIEQMLFSTLGKKYPDFGLVGEESYSAEDTSSASKKDFVFFIDSLDGTRAFVESVGVMSAGYIKRVLREQGIYSVQALKERFTRGEDYFFDKRCAAPCGYGVSIWGMGAYLEEKELHPESADERFMKRISEHAIMIGLVNEGESVAGVIYLPMAKQMYYGGVELGAFLDGKSISVSSQDDVNRQRLVLGRYNIGSRKLDDPEIEKILRMLPFESRQDSNLSANVSTNVSNVSNNVSMFDMRKIYENPLFKSIVNLEGSLGVKLCHVADATYDAFVHTDGMPGLWDVCAGEAILKAAGGRISDIAGKPFNYNGDTANGEGREFKLSAGVLATNSMLHEKNLQIIEEALK